MSQMIYLKETTTTTTEVETKIVEIPDYTDRLKELREQAIVHKAYSEVAQKRIADTASSPFEQMVIYVSELFKPFLNDRTINDYNHITGNSTFGFSCDLAKDDRGELCIEMYIYLYTKIKGWTRERKKLAIIYLDKMIFCKESIPTDTENIKALLDDWKYFKKSCNKFADSIIKEKQNTMTIQNQDYETTMDLINNFTV